MNITMSHLCAPHSGIHYEPADARLQEASLVRQCLDVATTSSLTEEPTCQQAQIFRLAAMLLRSSHPEAALNLQQAYDVHLLKHACIPLPPDAAIKQGWVLGLARFRDTLCRQLNSVSSPP